MEKKTTSALVLSAALAGAGVGRATNPSPPAPKLERICVEADGSAQIYVAHSAGVSGLSAHRQLLVPVDHALAVMSREGAKAIDVVPPGLSKAIRTLVDEAEKAGAGAK